ncbi:MAG: hypothetical protein AAF525_12860, partial [Pseudomonadota bacterium]
MLKSLRTRISVQILFCFVLVIFILTVGLALALFSFSSLESEQNEFAATTIPLVEKIESINRHTLNYVIEVESMLRSETPSESSLLDRRKLERDIQGLITDLKSSDIHH